MKPLLTFRTRLLMAALSLFPLLGRAQVQDLVVSTTQSMPGGTYNNVTITGTGILGLTSALTVNGTLTIEAGGRLSPNCNDILGPGNFDLQGNGALDICSVDGISQTGPTGSVLVTGTRSYSDDANYIYTGTTPGQVTGNGMPATVRSLQNFNTDGLAVTTDLNLATNVNVRQLVRVVSGTLNMNGRTLRLMSGNGGTALIVNTSGGTILGNVTVERAITAGPNTGAGYRHYAAPVGGQTLDNMATTGFAPVYNAAYNTSATPQQVLPFPTVYSYNQARVGTPGVTPSGFDQGWVSGASGEAMTAGKGFTVHIAPGSKVEWTGVPNNGNYDVTGLMMGANAESGWQFLGNPYPAPLNWGTLASRNGALVNVGDAMYVYETTGNYVGNYRSYVNGVGNPTIALGQGFFVRSTGSNGSVGFTNVDRVQLFDPVDGAFQRPAAETRPLVRLTLAETAGFMKDDIVVYEQAGAPAGFGPKFDALKRRNPDNLNVQWQLGADSYSIKGLSAFGSPTTTQVLPMAITLPAAGSYVLRVAELLNLPAGLTAYLYDAQSNTRTALTATSAYPFASASTTVNGRFSLELNPAGAPLANATAQQAALLQVYPNPARGSFHLTLPVSAKASQLQLLNTMGQPVMSRALVATDSDVDVQSLAAGVYTLRLNMDGATVSRKVVLQ
ncbi:T9SS type A sorting domain-containing protein [Hymenobacter sp. ASUV-10]|uniref:T9SS type A sorting domain-containing protein n=1 Tax=Hymenobacter aranciens TaxID=3063996 RepID=A0ABT9BB70_9BACT|nr:T9SS type A sorting domain-containing protein [Hymenobacter sp. ASUV-10]MDO7874272.1 T9SS type A sorting domain-containing protein [Hymenobacter sp. ASUV-10]